MLGEVYDLQRLYIRYNDYDECWELLERDGIPDTEAETGDDALLAKFYHGNPEDCPLARFVFEKIIEERAANRVNRTGENP